MVKRLALPALWLLPAPAIAHPELPPLATNLYVSLAAGRGRLVVSYALLHGHLAGIEERRRMDLDGDGTLSPQEVDRERARLVRDAPALLSVVLDGARLAAFGATVDLGGDPRVTASPVVMGLGASVDLAAGRHRVRIEPGREPPRLGESEVSLDLAPGFVLDSSRRGEAGEPGRERSPRFEFLGHRGSDGEDRSVTFVFSSAPVQAAHASPLAFVASLLAVAAAALAIAFRLARRRLPHHERIVDR